MKNPDFIIAGYQKCGTTALWKNLQQHPQIYMASREKDGMKKFPEIDFFCDWSSSTFDLGIDWYRSLFKEGYVCGEKSPSYAYNVESVKEYLPDVKIILSVRNPVDRAFSAFNFYKGMLPKSGEWGETNKTPWKPDRTFLHNFIDNDVFKKTGQYVNSIRRFYKHFPSKNIHIIIHEKLVNDYQKEYNKIFNFLSLDSIPITNRTIHKTYKPRELFEEERDILSAYYRPYNEELFKFLRYEIKEWN
jgi:hypothetical protein